MTGNRIVAVGFFGVYAQRRAGSINLITVIRAAAAAAFIAARDLKMRFARRAGFSFQQLSVNHKTDADAGTDGNQHGIFHSLGRTKSVFCPHGRVGVVFHNHRLFRQFFERRIHIIFGHIADRSDNPVVVFADLARRCHGHGINHVLKPRNHAFQRRQNFPAVAGSADFGNLAADFPFFVNQGIGDFCAADVKCQNLFSFLHRYILQRFAVVCYKYIVYIVQKQTTKRIFLR